MIQMLNGRQPTPTEVQVLRQCARGDCYPYGRAARAAKRAERLGLCTVEDQGADDGHTMNWTRERWYMVLTDAGRGELFLAAAADHYRAARESG